MPASGRKGNRAPVGSSEYADTEQGFDVVLAHLRQAGGVEIEMSTLDDLRSVGRVRSLPVLRHRPDDEAGWTHYLVLDGANRLAFRFTERARPAVGG